MGVTDTQTLFESIADTSERYVEGLITKTEALEELARFGDTARAMLTLDALDRETLKKVLN